MTATEETPTARLSRSESPTLEFIADNIRGHLRFAAAQVGELPRGAKILDFGCGIGSSVQALVQLGYDAFGVDVSAFWEGDFVHYWHAAERPPAELRARLSKIDTENYRLPFEDNTFDFCFSDQVFEHVFNYGVVFKELSRVLKPGAISAHRFPGPNSPIEGHVGIPIIPLCRYRWYLAFWAILGKRSVRQKGLGWKDTLWSNVDMMKQCSYPTKGALTRIAQDIGVRIEFMAEEGIRYTSVGRASKFARCARRFGLEGIALRLMATISQRYMVVYGS